MPSLTGNERLALTPSCAPSNLAPWPSWCVSVRMQGWEMDSLCYHSLAPKFSRAVKVPFSCFQQAFGWAHVHRKKTGGGVVAVTRSRFLEMQSNAEWETGQSCCLADDSAWNIVEPRDAVFRDVSQYLSSAWHCHHCWHKICHCPWTYDLIYPLAWKKEQE